MTRDEPAKWKVWDRRPWLYEGFDTSPAKLYEDQSDEDDKQQGSYSWEGPRCVNPAVGIEAGDLIVIDGFACPNTSCPGFGSGDGQVHLAEYLHRRGIRHLLYTGIHTNHCVVFTRPYSMWPMSSFKPRHELKEVGHRLPFVRNNVALFHSSQEALQFRGDRAPPPIAPCHTTRPCDCHRRSARSPRS